MKRHTKQRTGLNARRDGLFGTLHGFVRVLRVWRCLLRRGRSGLVLTHTDAQELLLSGMPGLTALPAALFAELPPSMLPPPFPACGETEEDLLACIRELERRCGKSFNWDAFLAACERSNRRSRAVLAVAEQLRLHAPLLIDTASVRAALGALCRRSDTERERNLQR